MLLKFIKQLSRGSRSMSPAGVSDQALVDEGNQLVEKGDTRGAIRVFRQYLERNPYDLVVLNNLGTCLAETGDRAAAESSFELAYSLDDRFIPAMVNHAKLLVDQHRGAEALPPLRRAKISEPGFAHTDAIYAALCLSHGDAPRARAFQKRAWLATFDSVRGANSHLFWMGYDDVDEAQIAAEHRFWAETLKPLPQDQVVQPVVTRPGDWRNRRIRVGYWSPDMRNHAVRYFFRPLLEGHDRDRVELFLYHDSPGRDVQTDRIEPFADHFHSVHELTDKELSELIRSHELDVLVDLAGHTSHNRVSLLQSRMARIQVNALGYPPTTGLLSIDAKLIDRHVLTPEADHFYAERPLALPSAFWCFDPMEPTDLAPEPPHMTNGFITFGAIGNIAKITEPVARAWVQIMAGVPGSRLRVRSVSFFDPLALDATRERLTRWGLPMDRVDLMLPKGGKDFFDSYNEVDIVLDTFPFNGGTTTCIATYMGAPVITLIGKSLIGRMGHSVLTNLGAADLATEDTTAYIQRAIHLAQDSDALRRFKREVRGRYLSTPLGNGKLFAAEFEQALQQALEEMDAGRWEWTSRVPPLPAQEIIRRAYTVMRTGQPDAARRILNYCLREYPDAGAAHLFLAQLLVWDGQVGEAIEHVTSRLESFSAEDRVPAWIQIARMQLLQQDIAGAQASLVQVQGCAVGDPFDAAQVKLIDAAVAAQCHSDSAEPKPVLANEAAKCVRFIVPCDSLPQFELLADGVREVCECPAGWRLEFERCDEEARMAAYEEGINDATVDILVLMQKNIEIHQPRFVALLVEALERADCVGFSGALRWARLDWRNDDFDQKAGSFIAPSSERDGMVELHVLGHGHESLVEGAVVLDGGMLALRPGARNAPSFDETLVGSATLLEEAWVHAAQRQGWRLAVHRTLGVFISNVVELDQSNRVDALTRCNEWLGFDPFAVVRDDQSSLSVPMPNVNDGVAVVDRYFSTPA